MPPSTPKDSFAWQRYPTAEAFVAGLVDRLVAAVPPVRRFQTQLVARTSTCLLDWIDHLVLADGDESRGRLADLGFELEDVPAEPGDAVYVHPGALFPRLVLRPETGLSPGEPVAAAIHVEDIPGFLTAQQVPTTIEGSPMSPYRQAVVWRAGRRECLAVERRGHEGFVPLEMPPGHARRVLHARERWAARPRRFDDPRAGLEQTLALTRSLVDDLGIDTACWIVFAVERAHWQQRNQAAQVQKSRQDSLGLGWANHDHHTFRSSRETFPLLIQILEALGFQPRERFYAGAEAGWGAQVLEQPTCRLAVFADVDLTPEEVALDFAHQPLASRETLGTVGLWCALHGESMLAAGLHHLACRLDFDRATAALAERGVNLMAPFSDFPYLRQAFSRGERWEVSPDRLERLTATGQISPDQGARFTHKGAVGSHLENIQRGEGFKGFNQQTISDIIRRTDPRTEHTTQGEHS